MASILNMLPGFRLVDGTLVNQIIGVVNNLTGFGTPQAISASAINGPAPSAIGATATLTAASAGKTFLLNTAAGSVATLPAATGTGNRYKFVVSVAASSNAHKILAASSSDNIIGFATGETAGTAKCFVSATATGNHSIQMPFAGTQPSGGFQGDWFEFDDVGTNLWHLSGCYQAGVTPTTPFSTATT